MYKLVTPRPVPMAYQGMGAPFRVYAGLGMTADEFDVDLVWKNILKESGCDYSKASNQCWKYGRTWAYNLRAALAALGFGLSSENRPDVSWQPTDPAKWKAFCAAVGIKELVSTYPAKKWQVQAVKDALIAGKVLGPDAPKNVSVATEPGGMTSIVGTKDEPPPGIEAAPPPPKDEKKPTPDKSKGTGTGTKTTTKKEPPKTTQANVWVYGGLAVVAIAAIAFFAKRKRGAAAKDAPALPAATTATPNGRRRRRRH